MDEERAKISAERARLEAVFLAEDGACYKKFFVNSCLGEVNGRRREAMADLRRQEILLNDEERRSKGVEQISYTHLRAHETRHDLVCRLLLAKQKKQVHLSHINLRLRHKIINVMNDTKTP